MDHPWSSAPPMFQFPPHTSIPIFHTQYNTSDPVLVFLPSGDSLTIMTPLTYLVYWFLDTASPPIFPSIDWRVLGQHLFSVPFIWSVLHDASADFRLRPSSCKIPLPWQDFRPPPALTCTLAAFPEVLEFTNLIRPLASWSNLLPNRHWDVCPKGGIAPMAPIWNPYQSEIHTQSETQLSIYLRDPSDFCFLFHNLIFHFEIRLPLTPISTFSVHPLNSLFWVIY